MVPAPAAAVHRPVLLAVRVPGHGRDPAAFLVLGLRFYRAVLRRLLPGAAQAADGAGANRAGVGRVAAEQKRDR
ncbi:hypothetical protein EMIT0324P_11750 [Pseudomonas chlororaphis]